MKSKFTTILTELKNHAPFTTFGAITGIILMLLFENLQHQTSHDLFYIFHPAHVVLSAMATASVYSFYTKKPKFVHVLLIGFFGSIGIATLSDSLIPYIGELLMGMHVHLHAHESFAEQAHIGFIEKWYIILPAAVAGVLIAYCLPKTKFPHAGHVLLSTWASSFHILMAMAGNTSAPKIIVSFIFLFLAVWLPCCVSDIVFPLLFANGKNTNLHHH